MNRRPFAGHLYLIRLLVPVGVLMILSAINAYADDVSSELVDLKASLPRVHGRIYIDGQTYNKTTVQLGNALDVSSARLSLSGRVMSDWRYLIQYDFAAKSLKDAWLRYDGWDAASVRIGNYQEPFSLEELTSSRFITFIHRGLPNALVPGYHVGIGAEKDSGFWSGAVGVFGDPVGSKTAKTGTSSWGITGRLTASPMNRDRSVVHVGISATYRLADNLHTLTIRDTPEAYLTSAHFVNTNNISAVDHFASAGVESAIVQGPVSFQAEGIETDVFRRGSSGTLQFRGAYGYVSWFPTGESRNYTRGTFGRIRPRHHMGAVELAARYSYIDLNSGSVSGGREENTTLGMNWYVNSHVRLMVNYVSVHARTVTGTEDPNIYLLRLQGDF